LGIGRMTKQLVPTQIKFETEGSTS
jgi:hypothetical protein